MTNHSDNTIQQDMSQPDIKWAVFKPDNALLETLAKQFSLHPLLVKILLLNRIDSSNPETIRTFLSPPIKLVRQYDQLSLPHHLDSALTRLSNATKIKEKILVNGDSDADGICSTSLVVCALRYWGLEVEYDFPIRSREGHGLQVRIIDHAKEKGITLIITTDCGTKDIQAIEYAQSLGIDVIVTDHHIIGKNIPPAFSIVNPKFFAESESLDYHLAGAGVALKLMLALEQKLKKKYPGSVFHYLLSLAALGTISDRMPLSNPINRAIVFHGIRSLNHSKSAGLNALKDISINSKNTDIIPREVSRTISPRLNAPGRIGDPELNIPDSNCVVDLLLSGVQGLNNTSKKRLQKYIHQFLYAIDFEKETRHQDSLGNQVEMVDEVNEERKKITQKIECEIEPLIESQFDRDYDKYILIKGNNWNSGVIGIDADRLRDRFNRPAIIVTDTPSSPYMKGSARSIPSINLYAIIDQVQQDFQAQYNKTLFEVEAQTKFGPKMVHAFGGHAQACGFSIHQDNYAFFAEKVREKLQETPDDAFKISYHIVDTLRFSDLTPKFIKLLHTLSPYGQAFEYPFFKLENCAIAPNCRPFGNRYQKSILSHVEFTILESLPSKNKKSYRGRKIPAVGFSLWERFQYTISKDRSQTYDIIFSIENERKRYRHKSKNTSPICLNVQDIRRHKGTVAK